MTTNYPEIAENYINGNLSDFKAQVKKLKKYQIIDLIDYFELFREEYLQAKFRKKIRECLID